MSALAVAAAVVCLPPKTDDGRRSSQLPKRGCPDTDHTGSGLADTPGGTDVQNPNPPAPDDGMAARVPSVVEQLQDIAVDLAALGDAALLLSHRLAWAIGRLKMEDPA